VNGCCGGVYHCPNETRDFRESKSWRRGRIGYSRKCPLLISEKKKKEGKGWYTWTTWHFVRDEQA
jgi:hypothetical protein